MSEYTKNNKKNANIGYLPFKLNCRYHSYIFFKKKSDLYLKFLLIYKFSQELREQIFISKQNQLYA